MTSKSWQLYLQMVGKQTRRWDKESSFIQLGTADLDGQSKRYRPGTETFSEEKLISISARPKFDESVELHDLCLWNFLPARYVFSFAHMRTREDQVHVLWVFSCLLSPVCWIFFFFNVMYWRILELFQACWFPYYTIRGFESMAFTECRELFQVCERTFDSLSFRSFFMWSLNLWSPQLRALVSVLGQTGGKTWAWREKLQVSSNFGWILFLLCFHAIVCELKVLSGFLCYFL